MLGCCPEDPRRSPDGRASGRLAARVRRPGVVQRRRDPHPRRRGRGTDAAGWGDRRRRGLHGRSLVKPGPAGAPAGRRPQPRGAGAARRLVAAAAADEERARPPGPPQRPSRGVAATSRPITTWATTSIACSSTSRWRTRAPCSPRLTSRSKMPSASKFRGDRGARRTSGWRARPGDRQRLGRVRPVRRRGAWLPRHDDHRLPGTAEAGGGTDRRGRARRPRQRRAARLPRDLGHLRRDRVDRDARGRRRGLLRDVLRGLRQGPGARRPDEPPGDHVSGCRLRAAAPGRQLDPDATSSRAVSCPLSR